MARLVHPNGDLQMNIDGVYVEGDALSINGKMGVWTAKIILSPEEVVAMARFLFQPQVIGYAVLLPWRLVRSRRRRVD
jgi:hypothetical protein